MATSLTLGNILKINSNSRHTPEVRHTSIYQLLYWEREARKHRRNGWSSNRKASIGKFTISSAYKVIIAVSPSSDNGAPFDCQKRSTFWKTVWGPYVPNKIKAFTWRACKNILLTKVNLCHRRVIDNPVCEACDLEAETSAHVFGHCEKAQEAWQVSSISMDTRGAYCHEFVDLF